MPKSTMIAAICLVAVCALPGALAQSGKPSDTVASVDGRVITRSELEQKEAARLLQASSDYYHAEREALDQLVSDELLENEARQKNITVQQLLDQEVNSKVKDPTDDQMAVFYEGLQTDQSFESLRPRILAQVRQARAKRARAAYVATLREKAKIQILLPSPSIDLEIGDAPVLGKKDAPLMLVEFADFECPFCQQMQPTIDKLLKEYDGRIAFVMKEMPLSIHPHAQKAAEAARCAGDQGAFWPYHDVLFHAQSNLEVPQLKEDARGLGLDATRFNQCLDSGQQAAAIQKDFAEGQQLGLTGTPSFFLNGHYFSGVVSYETLRQMVEEQLSAKKIIF